MESLSNPDNCPFLGSIILKKNKASDGPDSWTIIDGQQRLTTLSVLMRACYDVLDNYKDDTIIFPITNGRSSWSLVFDFPYLGLESLRVGFDNKGFKIRHGHLDSNDFKRVMSRDFKNAYNSKDHSKDGKIIQCYCYFREELEKSEKQDKTYTVRIVKDTIWNYLTKELHDEPTGKYLVFIELDEEENEQEIFDTINSAGVRLDAADTIKNVLFQHYADMQKACGIKEGTAKENAIGLCTKQWDMVFTPTPEDTKFWIGDGKSDSKDKNIELLLHSVALIRQFYDPEKDKLPALPKRYKEYLKEKLKTADDTRTFIEDISAFAGLYKKYFNIDFENDEFSYAPDDKEAWISRVVLASYKLNLKTFFPYILYLIKKNEDKALADKELIGNLAKLKKYLVLNKLCTSNNKSFHKECARPIRCDIDPSADNPTTLDSLMEKSENISEESFYKGLRKIKNDPATYLLFWLELKLRKENKYEHPAAKYAYTLEHIMPQKWAKNAIWKSVPIYDEDGSLTNDEKTRNSAVYQIGNMTLLTGSLNSAVSNSDIETKIKGNGKDEGLEKRAECNITNEVVDSIIDRSKSTGTLHWDEKDIYARTKDLYNKIVDLWGLPFAPK